MEPWTPRPPPAHSIPPGGFTRDLPGPRDHESLSSGSRDNACPVCGRVAATADYRTEEGAKRVRAAGTSSVVPLLREDAPAESPGKGSWRTLAPPATSLPTPGSRATLPPPRRPSLPGCAQLSCERHIPSRGESVVGFLTEPTQPSPGDSGNSNVTAAECEGEASVSTVRHELQPEVGGYRRGSLLSLHRDSRLGRSTGVPMQLPGRGTESLLSLGGPGVAPAPSPGDPGVVESARRTSLQLEANRGPVPP